MQRVKTAINPYEVYEIAEEILQQKADNFFAAEDFKQQTAEDVEYDKR